MKKVKIIIYSQNKTYGRRLFYYLEEKKNPHLKFYLATGYEGLEKMLKQEKITAVLLDKDLQKDILRHCETDWQNMLPDLPRFIWLTEDEHTGADEIYIYQRASEVYEQLRKLFSVTTEVGKRHLICVYSPEGGRDRTEFALSLCKEWLEKGPVIYLNLSGFPILFGEQLTTRPELTERGLSRLIFETSEKRFPAQLEQSSFFYENIRVIMPFWNYKDLLDVRVEDLKRLLELLFQSGNDPTIIMEMGQLFEYTFDVMELADEILLPMSDGIFDEIRLNVLKGYCRIEGKEELAERFQIIIDEGEEYDIYEEI